MVSPVVAHSLSSDRPPLSCQSFPGCIIGLGYSVKERPRGNRGYYINFFSRLGGKGMEYCVVEGKISPDTFIYQRSNVLKEDGFTLAVIHDCTVGVLTTKALEVLDFRLERLVPYTVEAIGTNFSPENIKEALALAFKRMDDEVRDKFDDLNLGLNYPLLEHTKLNSMVVIVGGGWIYTAGVANALVVVSRNSKQPLYLRTHMHVCWSGRRLPMCDHPDLFRYQQVRVQDDDAYIAIVTNSIWRSLRALNCFVPVLQTRIDKVGLVEACKSVVGRYEDDCKILTVITLQSDAHLPLGPGVQRQSIAEHLDEELMRMDGGSPVCRKEEEDGEFDSDDEYYGEPDPLLFLVPWVNGEQSPVPQTHRKYSESGIVLEACAESELLVVTSLLG